ncbi:MAG: antirestriction protein ArdA, partial [Nitrososphaerota archaeon]|nr:antirestriction protein ArdA [Nitrososphaerota archaeon]
MKKACVIVKNLEKSWKPPKTTPTTKNRHKNTPNKKQPPTIHQITKNQQPQQNKTPFSLYLPPRSTSTSNKRNHTTFLQNNKTQTSTHQPKPSNRSTNSTEAQTNRRQTTMCKQNNFSQKINPQQTNPQLKVYIANLSKHNNGELFGAWLNLPATHDEIKAFLKTKVGLNSQCEEYGVHDYESDFSLGEYENLYTLNMLAVVLEQ